MASVASRERGIAGGKFLVVIGALRHTPLPDPLPQGERGLRLFLKLAQIPDYTIRAFGVAGDAYIAAMQDQPVVGVLFPLGGDGFFECGFGGVGRGGFAEADAVGDAEYMRVDGDGVVAQRAIEPDICGFAADAGEGLQFLARVGNLSAEIVDQYLAELDDIAGLGVEQADGFDVVF